MGGGWVREEKGVGSFGFSSKLSTFKKLNEWERVGAGQQTQRLAFWAGAPLVIGLHNPNSQRVAQLALCYVSESNQCLVQPRFQLELFRGGLRRRTDTNGSIIIPSSITKFPCCQSLGSAVCETAWTGCAPSLCSPGHVFY